MSEKLSNVAVFSESEKSCVTDESHFLVDVKVKNEPRKSKRKVQRNSPKGNDSFKSNTLETNADEFLVRKSCYFNDVPELMEKIQKSFARRVPLPDPVNGATCVGEVPSNVHKVKLLISSKNCDNAEPVNGLKVPLRLSSKSRYESSKSQPTRRPRRKAAPRSFKDDVHGDYLDNEDVLSQDEPFVDIHEDVDNVDDSYIDNDLVLQVEDRMDCDTFDDNKELKRDPEAINLSFIQQSEETAYLTEIPEESNEYFDDILEFSEKCDKISSDLNLKEEEADKFHDDVTRFCKNNRKRSLVRRKSSCPETEEFDEEKLNVKSSEDSKNFGCMYCDFLGPKKSWLAHLKTEHSDKNLVYCNACRTCQLPFETEQQLENHIHDVHMKKFICNVDDCGKVFRKKSSFRMHRKIHQKDSKMSGDRSERSYVCTFCGKKYRTRNGFRAHEAMVHTKKLKHNCPQDGCTAAFFYSSELEVHMRKHTGELPFTCSFCGARYISHATLAQHEKAAHLQTEDTHCHICNKKLRKRNMAGHLKTHEGYQGIPCSICGKEFPTIGGKNRHEKIHFEIKQHACRFCGKSFVQRANMVAHERIHTGEKPFKCKFCEEGFPQQTRRNQHEQTCKQRTLNFST